METKYGWSDGRTYYGRTETDGQTGGRTANVKTIYPATNVLRGIKNCIGEGGESGVCMRIFISKNPILKQTGREVVGRGESDFLRRIQIRTIGAGVGGVGVGGLGQEGGGLVNLF